jgi:hypothetical protein
MSVSDERLHDAIRALSESDAFRDAESLVARAAPELQHVLAQALAAGGYFGEASEQELQKALELPEAERAIALRVLLAEETRMGMMVGVAVGWELARELEIKDDDGGD